jgi:hypothetical protein
MSNNARCSAVLALVMVALVISVAGCSRFLGPSDEDILKAIEASGILKSAMVNVTGPLAVVGRGGRTKEGYWPVKVKLTLVMQKPDGSMTEPREQTASFKIMPIKDTAGKRAWKAVL